jgi:hypothetical protein
MLTNREVVQKADMALGDLAPGGELVEEQAKKFLKIAIKKNVLTSQVRAPTMNNKKFSQPKLIWTGRVMQKGTGGTALAESQRSKPTTGKVDLEAQLGKAEVHMEREILEDQIERGTFKNTVIKFMGEKVSADFEDLLIQGDTTSSDDWLSTTDGVIKLITTNTNPAGGVTLEAEILRDTLEVLPDEFEEQEGLAFWTNRKARQDHRDELRTSHPDSIGAAVVAGGLAKDVGYDDIPLKKVPRFPNNLGGGSNETVVLLLAAKNILMGFYRKVTLETEFRISEQNWVIVVTVRIAVQIEHEPACAKTTGVLGQS